MLTDTHLKELKKIFKKSTGREMTDAQALEDGKKLIRLLALVKKPMNKAEYDELQARCHTGI